MITQYTEDKHFINVFMLSNTCSCTYTFKYYYYCKENFIKKLKLNILYKIDVIQNLFQILYLRFC